MVCFGTPSTTTQEAPTLAISCFRYFLIHRLARFVISSKSKRKSNIRLPIKVPRYPFNRVYILSSARKEGCLVAIRRIIGIHASSFSPGVGEKRPKKKLFLVPGQGVLPASIPFPFITKHTESPSANFTPPHHQQESRSHHSAAGIGKPISPAGSFLVWPPRVR